MPASSRRRTIHGGEGPTWTSMTIRAVNRGHSSRSSTRTEVSDSTGGPGPPADTSPGSGTAKGRRRRGGKVTGHADHAPGVGAIGLDGHVEHDIGLDTERHGEGGAHGGAPRPLSTRMPSWSSETPSSLPEHSMPLETTPFIFRRVIVKSPGRTAPTGARGTRSPTAKFEAPHTTSTGPAPSSTTTRRMRSAPSMGAISPTRAITTSDSPSPTRSTPSTTRPRSSRAAARSAGSPSKGAKSRSHESGTRTSVLSGRSHQN